jgi:hypothetical protein
VYTPCWKKIQKGTWVLSWDSSLKWALKRVIAALWMENDRLVSEHKKSKMGNSSSLRVVDETKSPPCWRSSFLDKVEVVKAMWVYFDFLWSLYLRERLQESCWSELDSVWRSFIAPHEIWSKSEFTTKFAKSSPLINLQTRTKHTHTHTKEQGEPVKYKDVTLLSLSCLYIAKFLRNLSRQGG